MPFCRLSPLSYPMRQAIVLSPLQTVCNQKQLLINEFPLSLQVNDNSFIIFSKFSCLQNTFMLQYLKKSDPFYQTENFPRIVERVNYFKVQKEGVTIMCEIADKIRQEGRATGIIEGKIESILELLEERGNIPKQLIQRIRKETNSEVLSKWHKYAAKATSFAEFEANM